VRPGDLVRLPVKAIRRRGPVWRFAGEAYVGEQLCAEAEYSAMIAYKDRPDGSASDRDH
jgi:3-hydroxyacyl-[acyl-carrier-protein] dehydratase